MGHCQAGLGLTKVTQFSMQLADLLLSQTSREHYLKKRGSTVRISIDDTEHHHISTASLIVQKAPLLPLTSDEDRTYSEARQPSDTERLCECHHLHPAPFGFLQRRSACLLVFPTCGWATMHLAPPSNPLAVLIFLLSSNCDFIRLVDFMLNCVCYFCHFMFKFL